MPWTTELTSTCGEARKILGWPGTSCEFEERVVISQEGESLVAALMNTGVKFCCFVLFTKLVVGLSSAQKLDYSWLAAISAGGDNARLRLHMPRLPELI